MVADFLESNASLSRSSSPDSSIPGEETREETRKKTPDERLVLMRALLASLAGSHRALLTLDLVGVREGTNEQVLLSRKLKLQLCGGSSQVAVNSSELPPSNAELRESEALVRQGLRLQLALLRRAQHKLMVLANTLSGSTLDYGPLLARRIFSSGSTAHAKIPRLRKTG